MSMATTASHVPATEQAIDNVRQIKVICIGAGISGILAGIRLPQKIKNLDLTIYEKNEDIGGTWFENRYPGVSSDIPSHAYQYTFADNHHWKHFYASGPEMRAYLDGVAKKYGVRRYVKLRHVFKGAKWLADQGRWEVKILRLQDNHTFVETADVVLKATGLLNTWKWPAIPGLHSFKGKLLHSADYDASYNAKDKNVAVVGNGSTGIQLVPALQPVVSRLTNYTRSKSWVSPRGPYAAEIERRGGNENFEYTEEEQREFDVDPEKYRKYRREVEQTFLRLHLGLFRDSPALKKGSKMVEDLVREKLKERPDIFKTIKPEYPVGCKRLGAGPGYLEALCKDNVELVTCGIKQVVADGIIDGEGMFRPADAIMCATGFDNSLNNQAAPIIGQDGVPLDDVWKPEPEAYLGLCAVKTPNMFFLLGPGGAPQASMISMAEFQMNYVVKAVQKIQREHIKSMVVSVRAKDGFVKVADKYFAKTVLTEDCASWYKSKGKADGRIQAIWPGALSHARYTLENPRWEDFEYELSEDLEDNPLAWMGNGTTLALIQGGNLTDHLDEVDIPPVVKKAEESRLEVDPADLELPVA